MLCRGGNVGGNAGELGFRSLCLRHRSLSEGKSLCDLLLCGGGCLFGCLKLFLFSLVLFVLYHLIGIGNAGTNKEFVVNDEFCLQIAQKIVQLDIHINKVISPDIVSDRVMLAESEIVLKLLSVLIRDYEVESGTVFDGLQERILDIALFVDRRTGELEVSVKHDTYKGHRVARIVITARIKRHIYNVVGVSPGVSVSSARHYLKRVSGGIDRVVEFFQRVDRIFLRILAVQRILFVEVRVEVGTESRNRYAGRVVLKVIREQLGDKFVVP